MFSKLKIRTKLMWLLISLSLIPFIVIGLISSNVSLTALENLAFAQLTSIRDSKKAQIERYFEKVHSDIKVLAGSSHIVDALDAFSSAFNNGNIDTTQYDYFESLEYGASFKNFLKEYAYYDLMLITKEGNIVYSLKRESDLSENIISGPLKKSNLSKFFNKGLESLFITDFKPYPPSNNRPIAFVISPIVFSDSTEGVVVLKLTNDTIDTIMMERSGMGETSEAYLVGPDQLMRSDSFLNPKYHTVEASFANPQKGSVDTIATREALSGKADQKIIADYRGVQVLSAYVPVHLHHLTYALIAEIDEAEAFGAINRLRSLMTIVALVIVIVILFISLFMANKFTKPIITLTESSIEIAEGKLDKKIEVSGDDELGLLARNFKKMRDSIREKISDLDAEIGERTRAEKAVQEARDKLEERVKERTAELEQTNEQMTAEMGERQRAEEALKESEERMKLALIGGNLGFWDIHLQTGAAVYDERWAQMFGYELDEIEQSRKTWVDSIHPDDRQRIITVEEDYRSGAIAGYAIEHRAVTKQGDTIWVNSKGTTVERDEQGFPIRLVGTIIDITERKLAEMEQARRLRAEKAMAAVSQALLSSDAKQQTMQDTLEQLAVAAQVDRVYVFQNFEDPEKGLCMRLVFEACTSGVDTCGSNFELSLRPYRKGLTRWEEEFRNDKPVMGPVDTFPEEEQEVLKPQETLSTLLLPIQVQGQWYGFIGFDDTFLRRDWSSSDVNLLSTISEIIGAFLTRQQAEQEINKAKEVAEVRSIELQKEMGEREKMAEDLRSKMEDLQRFRRLAVGREKKMIELKKEINELANQSDLGQRYKIVK